MKITEITSCYLGPQISPEQFVPEHVFIFLLKGTINGYDGTKHTKIESGECCLVRKNRLARYNKQKDQNDFEKAVIILDEEFLKKYQKKYAVSPTAYFVSDIFIPLNNTPSITKFMLEELLHYKDQESTVQDTDGIREQFLQLLLQAQPELINLFFDFGKPGRIDLEAYMQRHYKFNVSLERLAYLTGRSLSAFKRDFKDIFKQTPNRWLVQRRLEEAHFLIEKEKKISNEIYLDLGFEDLSHFSFAFKRHFGYNATEIAR
ncbi:AraC-like DNA-binding protein [Pedobacter cryoconitis]|uniref:AraC-like DNA-binding protein n=1 Tax=Pedobacter cryoconitis TaxID=188932 RepID=A0A7W9DZF9_9SPHI|nr:helix-turn-helix domain-containing protein [Pedobacter cryoconitis]MBB5637297.1 AraC-like DNA-binding protein [Pedobacter cryoconitis]MBB6269727.1 AraC-like DNA-binding protein [Pedobacter cryoconitis]